MASADWILTDANIWTGRPAAGPRPTAMALREGRILALGSNHDISALRSPDTAELSLEGGFVAPGFIDAHVHLQAGGLQLFRVDLRGVRSPEEFIQRVADRTRSTPPGTWILGGDWNQEDWGGTLPTRDWLDRAAPDHPVFLYRTDLHMGVANTLGLTLAGIDRETPDPEHGHIDRAPETGEPTGILRERAIVAISEVIPPPTEGQRWGAIRAAALHALSHGVTQLHDMGALLSAEESWRSFHLLRTLRAEGRLPLRVVAHLPLKEREEVAELVAREGYGDELLRWGGVKAFVDGSLGSTTAWFHEPYLGEPGNVGHMVQDPEELSRELHEAVDAKLRPAVHSIGDRANDWILEVFEEIHRRHPDRDLRLRLEHGQHMTPAAIARAGRMGQIVSAQPLHLVDDGIWAGRKLGPDREAGSFAFASLLRAGARLAFGSDWTAAPIDPIGTLQAAVTRRLRSWEAERGTSWTPEERLDLEASLTAHTLGGAVAGFMEKETGTLEAGKRGDFVVLSADPFQMDPDRLGDDVWVDMTFLDGVLAYRRDPVAATGVR